MIMHLQDLNLSKDEKERVEALHQTYGFIVYNAGFSCTMEGDRKVEMCYWRNRRGVRESALFPSHEAAWRDALRVHEEAVEAVKANPGVHRVARMPLAESVELNRLKRRATAAGYAFSNSGRGEIYFTFDGCKVVGFKSHADCIRDAIRHWARRDPDSFVNMMNAAGQGEEPSSIHDDKPLPTFTVGARNFLPPLSAAELAELQGFPGYDEMPEEHKQLTAQAKQIIKLMQLKGITLDMTLLAGTVEEAACVAYKSQGKTFEEVEEDQRNATRAYGVVTGSEEEGRLRALECCGYSFVFTSTKGWTCPSIENCAASGALETVIRAAWFHAIENGGDEKQLLATAAAYTVRNPQ